MKLASVNTTMDFNPDALMSKDVSFMTSWVWKEQLEIMNFLPKLAFLFSPFSDVSAQQLRTASYVSIRFISDHLSQPAPTSESATATTAARTRL